MAVPTITGISPSSGTTAGTNPVVITGTNFQTPVVTVVNFNGNTAGFTVDSDTQITATAPAHAAGPFPVTVTNADGTSTAVDYTYTTGLTLAPASGTTAGGNTVAIYASNLANTSAVKFGAASATSFTQVSPTEVTAVAPAGSGVVGLTVTTPGGTSAPKNYYYVNQPTKTSITPTSGSTAGGTAVTISGANLVGATSVTIGGAAATITGTTAGSITATTPAGTAGNASVVVTTPGGSTDGLTFTYVDVPAGPFTMTPTVGSINGGDTVTITGTNLTTTTGVTFGGTAASFAVFSDTEIAVITPAHAAGDVTVVVTDPAGNATVGTFTYQGAPGG